MTNKIKIHIPSEANGYSVFTDEYRERVAKAAPDMLEALQLAVIRDPSLKNNVTVMNAIAKATGA